MGYKLRRKELEHGQAADKAQSSEKHIPFTRFISDKLLTTKNGDIVAIFEMDGIVYETLSDNEIKAPAVAMAELIQQLEPSIAVYCHTIKYIDPIVYERRSDNQFVRYCADSYINQINSSDIYLIRHFFTLVKRPSYTERGLIKKVRSIFGDMSDSGQGSVEGAKKERSRQSDALEIICNQTLEFLDKFKIKRLSRHDPQLMSFLGFLVNGQWQDYPRDIEFDLANVLPQSHKAFAGEVVKILNPVTTKRAAGLGVISYGNKTDPHMFDALLAIPSEFILTQSFIRLDDIDSSKLVRTRIGSMKDDDAQSLMIELTALLDNIASKRACMGKHHISLMILSDTDLTEKISKAVAALAQSKLKVRRESLNLEPSWWAQLPGNFNYQTRSHHSNITNHNFAEFAACHAFAKGETTELAWQEPIMPFQNNSGTAYQFSFHGIGKKASGNFCIFGPAGTGKTALNNIAVTMSLNLKKPPRIIYFDKDLGSKAFIEALGGNYHIFNPGESCGFNPVQSIEDEKSASWLAGFLERLSGLDLNVEQSRRVAQSCLRVLEVPHKKRTLRETVRLFASLDDDTEFKQSLRDWHGKGTKAWLFDNPEDTFTITKGVNGIDMSSIYGSPVVRSAALDYIFYRIEEVLKDGYPTIIVLEEAWQLLDDPRFMDRTKDWIKTIRKLNGVVGFLTQEPSDAANSPICDTLISNTETKIFLANPTADEKSHLGAFKLSQIEFEIVRAMRAKQRYALVKKTDHSCLLRLSIKDEAILKVLSGTAATTKEALELQKQNPDNWLEAFMGVKFKQELAE